MEDGTKLTHHWHDETVELAVKTAGRAGNVKADDQTPPYPGFVWLGGFKSDMAGTKAEAMVARAAQTGCASLRFDYSGHGEFGGQFEDGTISRWVDESLAVLRGHSNGPQILVGSSMGGWIALRLAQELKKAGEDDRLAGLLLIAPAPDFTAELMEPRFTTAQRCMMETQGYFDEPSDYSDEPNIITRALIEDGRDNLVLNSDLVLGVPVRILQGMQDPDVPHTHALRLVEALPHDDVVISLIRDGDHRLSRDQDIALMQRTMDQMVDDRVDRGQ